MRKAIIRPSRATATVWPTRGRYLTGTSGDKISVVQAPRPGGSFLASTRYDFFPNFSPDGKRITFTSRRSGTDEIWVCDSDGSNALQVTSFGGPFTGNSRWSPDGSQLAFESTAQGDWNIYVINANGGKPRVYHQWRGK